MRVSDGERRVHGERAVQPATGFGVAARDHALQCQCRQCERTLGLDSQRVPECCDGGRILATEQQSRSEEHTSELQSRLHLVCRLLLEKKKNNPSLLGNRRTTTTRRSRTHGQTTFSRTQ